ncbi:MAG TPA: nickel insertion protein, partial [Thermoanaerobaculia bacterium]|nr:nickel insertion protein [Thermoanaerobaculia bacterium]
MGGRLHLDCASGLAGDMFLAAACDLGVPRQVIDEAVAALDLPGVTVETWSDRRGGVTGTRLRVLQDGRPVEEEGGHGHRHEPHENLHEYHRHHDHSEHEHPHHQHEPHHHGRDLAEIRRLIEGGSLAAAVRERALQLFARLGEAEARVHGVPVDRVHFHEVGAVDSIVDLVGAAAVIEHLAPERV